MVVVTNSKRRKKGPSAIIIDGGCARVIAAKKKKKPEINFKNKIKKVATKLKVLMTVLLLILLPLNSFLRATIFCIQAQRFAH